MPFTSQLGVFLTQLGLGLQLGRLTPVPFKIVVPRMRNLPHPHSISDESLELVATGQVAVGTAAVQLDTFGWIARKSVIIKAAPANTGKVYVGAGQNVSVNNGYELAPGAQVELKVYDLTTIWLLGSASSQAVSWIAV